jgi:PST family polysaccharide transporter
MADDLTTPVTTPPVSAASRDLKRNVSSGLLWSGIGRVVQQAIQFGLTVILSRLLSPADYGLMAMVMVFTGFAGMLADVGFNSALVQKAEVTEKHINSVFWLSAVTGLFLAGVTCVIAPWLAVFFKSPALIPIFRVISVNFILSGLAGVPYAMLQRNMQFRTIAKIGTVSIFMSGIVGVVFALSGAGTWSLVVQSVVCAILVVVMRWWACPWRPRLECSFSALKDLFGFSGNLYAFTFVNYWARNADNLVVGKYFGASALGAYSRAYGLMLLPVTQIQSVVYQVMLPALSSIQHDKERVKRIFLRAVGVITLLTFPMMLGLCVVASPFVLAVYGAKWNGVTPILQILAIVGLMQSLTSATGLLLMSQGRTDVLFRWWSLFSALVIVSFGVGVMLGSVWALAICYAVANVFYFYPALIISGRVVDLSASEILASVAGPFFTSLGMAGVVYCVALLLPITWPIWLMLTVLVTVGAVVYVMAMVVFKLTAWLDLRQIILGKIKNKKLKRLLKRLRQFSRRFLCGMPRVKQLRMKWEMPQSYKLEFPELPSHYRLVEYSSVAENEWLRLLNSSGEFGTMDHQSLRAELLENLIPGTAVFVKSGDELIGCASVCAVPVYEPYGVLMYVIILPHHRGFGLGRLVAMKSIARANSAGYRRIILHTDDHRIAAIRLYHKLGFEPVYQRAEDRQRWAAVFEKMKLSK